METKICICYHICYKQLNSLKTKPNLDLYI